MSSMYRVPLSQPLSKRTTSPKIKRTKSKYLKPNTSKLAASGSNSKTTHNRLSSVSWAQLKHPTSNGTLSERPKTPATQKRNELMYMSLLKSSYTKFSFSLSVSLSSSSYCFPLPSILFWVASYHLNTIPTHIKPLYETWARCISDSQAVTHSHRLSAETWVSLYSLRVRSSQALKGKQSRTCSKVRRRLWADRPSFI